MEENVQAITAWEQAILLGPSKVERLSDWIASRAASGRYCWFTSFGSPCGYPRTLAFCQESRPFDPFPFPFLNMTVPMEAIFLALFVLASQNRLSRQSDKRSHLDLQIDLLAEREMTAVLQLLQDIALHLKVKTSVTAEQLRDLAKKTDLDSLTDRMEEFSDESCGRHGAGGNPSEDQMTRKAAAIKCFKFQSKSIGSTR